MPLVKPIKGVNQTLNEDGPEENIVKTIIFDWEVDHNATRVEVQ